MNIKYSSTLSLTSTLDGDGWSTPSPACYTPGKEPVLIVQEAGWNPRAVWRIAKNLAHNGIRSPVRQPRSESPYRLPYTGPQFSSSTHWIRNWISLGAQYTSSSLRQCENEASDIVPYMYQVYRYKFKKQNLNVRLLAENTYCIFHTASNSIIYQPLI